MYIICTCVFQELSDDKNVLCMPIFNKDQDTIGQSDFLLHTFIHTCIFAQYMLCVSKSHVYIIHCIYIVQV